MGGIAINTFIAALILVVTSLAASVGGLLLIRRRMDHATLKSCHEVGGFLFAAISTLYAVLLGLLVVDALTKFQDAQHQTEQEANSVACIYMLAANLPEPKRQQIQSECVAYCQDVVEKEWPAMDAGKYSTDARVKALQLFRSVASIKAANETDSALASTAMQEACDFWSARRSRIVTAVRLVPPIEWTVLILGGVITIAFTYFFGLENLTVQVAMTAMVGLMTSLNLLLFYMFSQPHSGCIRVKPDSFLGDLMIFQGREYVLPEMTSKKNQKPIEPEPES